MKSDAHPETWSKTFFISSKPRRRRMTKEIVMEGKEKENNTMLTLKSLI